MKVNGLVRTQRAYVLNKEKVLLSHSLLHLQPKRESQNGCFSPILVHFLRNRNITMCKVCRILAWSLGSSYALNDNGSSLNRSHELRSKSLTHKRASCLYSSFEFSPLRFRPLSTVHGLRIDYVQLEFFLLQAFLVNSGVFELNARRSTNVAKRKADESNGANAYLDSYGAESS